MESVRRSSLMRLTAILRQTAFLLALVAVSASAQKDKQRTQEQQEFLNQQLLNESFESKILIGNCEFDSFGGEKFPVDTEIHADLRISYYVRKTIETTGGAGTRCLEEAYQPGVMKGMPPNTIVTIRRIEIKGNRFELALEGPKSELTFGSSWSPGIGNTYGRLKFFYGGAYAEDSAPLVLLMYVSKVLRLQAFERIEQARKQYRDLVQELASAYSESRSEVPTGGASPPASTLVSSTDYFSFLRMGSSAFESSEWDQALAYFQKASALEPTRPDAWAAMGRAYLASGQYGEIPAAWDKALGLGGSLTFAVCHAGFACGDVGNFLLSVKETSFVNKKGEKEFAAAPSAITSVKAASHGLGSTYYWQFEFERKNYRFYYIPIGIQCRGNFICPEPGLTQQTVVADYISQTIPKLASGVLAIVPSAQQSSGQPPTAPPSEGSASSTQPTSTRIRPNDEEVFRSLVQEIATQISLSQPEKGRPAREQLNRLHALEVILQKIIANRDEYLAAVQQLQAASLFEPADKEIWEQAGERMRVRLVELEARVKEERKQELRSGLDQKRKEYESQKALLPKSAPRGLDQLNSAIERDEKCIALLDQRRPLINELAQLGEPQTSSEVAEIEKEQTQLQQLRQQWEAIRRPLELTKLNDDYVELTLRRHELDRRSTADPSVQSALRALLEQLRANRERAVQLGETRATKQLDEIRRRIAAMQ